MEKIKKQKQKDLKPIEELKSKGWDSGIKVLKSVTVIIPLKLLLVCNQISDQVNGDEFSIVTNIKEKDETSMLLSDEFYIPKQEVAHTSIEYKPDSYVFNTVIHRHPDGMNNFSSTDRDYINQNFELSILYTKEEGFVRGVYNLKHLDYLIQLPVEIIVNYGLGEIDISNISRIDDRKYLHDYTYKRFSKDPSPLFKDTESEFKNSDNENLLNQLHPEEKLEIVKESILEEVTGEISDINFRLDNLEENIFRSTGFNAYGHDGPGF